MQRVGRRRIQQVFTIGAAAAGIVAVVAVPTLVPDDDLPPPGPDMVLSDYLPVADDEGVEYEVTVIPGTDEIVSSVGTSDENLIATTDGDVGDNLDSVVIYEGSEEVATFDGVRGIALSDPGGSLAAWVEVTTTATEELFEVVAVNTSTGEELDRLPVSWTTNVMAVRGNTVAINDTDASQLWTVGSSTAEPLQFLPSDEIIVGFTGSRIIATDFEAGTTIYERSTGTEVATITDLATWDTNIDGDLLVGATAQGDVRQVELSTGASTLIDTSVDAGTAAFSEDDSVVVQSVAAFTETAPEHNVDICPQGQACTSVVAEGAPLIPNDAVGQLGSQSQ